MERLNTMLARGVAAQVERLEKQTLRKQGNHFIIGARPVQGLK
jgi:hypothetical protein